MKKYHYKAMIWLFIPTLTVFLIGSFLNLNFSWFLNSFFSEKPYLRILILLIEISGYIIAYSYYKKKFNDQ